MLLSLGNIYDIALDLPAYVSAAALLAFALLLPLYVSQRRDVQRLRQWMEREPEHPKADLAASEALLDRAEAELESALGPAVGEGAVVEPTEVKPPPAPGAHPTPVSAARRVAHERPALERITMEREALLPHPRWRRLVNRVGQPRVLSVTALLAVVLGLVGIFGSERILRQGSEDNRGAVAVVPGNVTVAVLNGTSVPGLAAKVGDDVRVNGFELGAVSNSRRQFDQTVVMYEPHQQRAAKKVAHDLGLNPVQPIDRETQRIAGGADVVVIAGADRAKP
jgi:LytR cell envelope-related transcriptional attenuator